MSISNMMKIKLPSLLLMVTVYMFLQYLSVPIVNALFFGGHLDWILFLSALGILSFMGGFSISNKYNLIRIEKAKDLEESNVNIFKYSAIICLTIGMLIKLKSCIPIMIGGDCNKYLNALLKPNYLYQAAFTFFSIFLILKAKNSIYKYKKIFYILFFTLISISFLIFVMTSGVGRTMSISYLLSILLILFSLEERLRRFDYILGSVLIVIFLWFLFSFFKSYQFESKELNSILGIDFLMVNIINRISHAHILSAIYDVWPKNLYLYFYGITDFFTIPSIGIDRHYLNGNDFGQALKIIGKDDFVTGIAPTFIGDLYIRGGTIFILTGMFIVGYLYGSFENTLNFCSNEIKITFVGMIYPYLLYCTEDYIFLSMSTALIMSLFYLLVLSVAKKINNLI